MSGKEIAALVCCTFLLVVAWVVLGLRVYGRVRVGRGRLGGDDGFCFGAAIFYIVQTAFMFLEIMYGAGKRRYQVSDHDFLLQRRALYISQIPYLLALFSLKTSLLLHYRRLFSSPLIRKSSLFLLALVLASTITFVFLFAFQCTPVSAFWKPSDHVKCIPLSTIEYAFLSVNFTINVLLLMLPITMLRKIPIPRMENRALVLILGIGALAALTSVFRLPFVGTMGALGPDLTHSNYSTFSNSVWTRVEVGLGILAACLPTLRPMLGKWFPRHWGNSNLQSEENSRYERGASSQKDEEETVAVAKKTGKGEIDNPPAEMALVNIIPSPSPQPPRSTLHLTIQKPSQSVTSLLSRSGSVSPSLLGLHRSPSALLKERDEDRDLADIDEATDDGNIRVTTVTQQRFDNDSQEELRQPESVAEAWGPARSSRGQSVREKSWGHVRRKSGKELLRLTR